ncbi:MAG: hypothetical protein PVG30_08965, partial [Gammaproteobacteria bacterium]
VAYSKSLFVGGNFTDAGDITANRIAKWDGSSWSALASGAQTGIDNFVLALTNDSSGNLYAGGNFTTAGGMPVNYIAKWNGSAWSALTSGSQTGVENTVSALTNDTSGNLYVGGSFTTAGGMTVNYIAKWDGTAWSALASGSQTGVDIYYVRALNYSSGDLYAGGDFTTAGGMTVNYIAKWNGYAWGALESGGQTGVSGGLGYVYAIINDSSGNVYAGGRFIDAGGITVNRIAKWDGSAWSALASGGATGTNYHVYALTIDNSGNLFVGGQFTTAVGMPVNRIAKWDDSTSTWSALVSGGQTGVGGGLNPSVNALTNDNAGDVYAGGVFATAGEITANNIAKWNGSAWSALTSGGQTGTNDIVYSIYVLPIIESITAVSTTTPRFKHKVLKPGNKYHIQKHRK